jgi:fructuronate reductase
MPANRLSRSTSPARVRPPRIVHIGLGNFSRAHQAWYTARADESGDWGVIGFTGRSGAIADALAPQHGLYTLIERGPHTDRLEIIDIIQGVRPASDLAALGAAVSDPLAAVVTLTITEAGYVAASDGALGRLALALRERASAGGGPIALVSADNLTANGSVLRSRVLELAERLDRGLPAWIEREVAFVASSADRITPRTTEEDRALVERQIGLVDVAPVVCEPFADWVICGEFPAGRPPWESAGARFVEELAPWERRKLWLLNGGHSLLAYLGLERGHETVAQALEDADLALALGRFWDLAERYLPEPELDIAGYRRRLAERFANHRIAYPLRQIAADGLDKLRNRVLPVIDAARAAGEPDAPAMAILSAWTRWLIADPARCETDQNAAQLRGALATSGGEDKARALLELLAPELASAAVPTGAVIG